MLIQPDRWKLGDGEVINDVRRSDLSSGALEVENLDEELEQLASRRAKASPQETIRALYESTDRRLERFRLSDHQQLKNDKERTGTPCMWNELVRKILKLNPSLWVEDSKADPSNVGLYRVKKPKFEGDPDKEFLVAFQKSVLPEFSIVITDAADLPVKEVRGWRTVLLRLIMTNAITLKQALDVFSDTYTVASDRWRSQTQRYRT